MIRRRRRSGGRGGHAVRTATAAVAVLLLVAVSGAAVASASSSSGGVGAPRRKAADSTEFDYLQGTEPDPFVHAAPLVVAAACADGVVVVAAHTPDAEEPLLYYRPKPGGGEGEDEEEEDPFLYFDDLPSDYGGPFRIHVLDHRRRDDAASRTLVLVCTGWRADCETLASLGRALSIAETSRYGGGSPSTGGAAATTVASDSEIRQHGAFISKRLSSIMASTAISEGVSSILLFL